MQQRLLLQILSLAQHVSGILQTGHITPSSTPDQQLENHSTKYHRQQPLYNTRAPNDGHSGARNILSNKKTLLLLVGILFPHINDDVRSKSHQMRVISLQ
jgi:hypothetical protein